MAITVKKWIGSNGDVLIPLSEETYNNGNMVSKSGVFYFAVTEDDTAPVQGNPMGLLLTLTYASNP